MADQWAKTSKKFACGDQTGTELQHGLSPVSCCLLLPHCTPLLSVRLSHCHHPLSPVWVSPVSQGRSARGDGCWGQPGLVLDGSQADPMSGAAVLHTGAEAEPLVLL